MNTAKLTIFFDGECPLCKREVDFLESRNQKGYLRFIDINSSDFYLDLKYGITYKQAMERIHALKSDGSLTKAIRLFQEAYDLIGLGRVYASSKLPVIDILIYFIYQLWVKYRLEITFRPYIKKFARVGSIIYLLNNKN